MHSEMLLHSVKADLHEKQEQIHQLKRVFATKLGKSNTISPRPSISFTGLILTGRHGEEHMLSGLKIFVKE